MFIIFWCRVVSPQRPCWEPSPCHRQVSPLFLPTVQTCLPFYRAEGSAIPPRCSKIFASGTFLAVQLYGTRHLTNKKIRKNIKKRRLRYTEKYEIREWLIIILNEVSVERMHPFPNKKFSPEHISCFLSYASRAEFIISWQLWRYLKYRLHTALLILCTNKRAFLAVLHPHFVSPNPEKKKKQQPNPTQPTTQPNFLRSTPEYYFLYYCCLFTSFCTSHIALLNKLSNPTVQQQCGPANKK